MAIEVELPTCSDWPAQVLRVLCERALLRGLQLRQLQQQPGARGVSSGGGGSHPGAEPQRLPPQDPGQCEGVAILPVVAKWTTDQQEGALSPHRTAKSTALNFALLGRDYSVSKRLHCSCWSTTASRAPRGNCLSMPYSAQDDVSATRHNRGCKEGSCLERHCPVCTTG